MAGSQALFFRGAGWRCPLHVRSVCTAGEPNDWGLLPPKPAEVGLSPFTLFYLQNGFRLLFPDPPSGHFPFLICVGLELPNLRHSTVWFLSNPELLLSDLSAPWAAHTTVPISCPLDILILLCFFMIR